MVMKNGILYTFEYSQNKGHCYLHVLKNPQISIQIINVDDKLGEDP